MDYTIKTGILALDVVLNLAVLLIAFYLGTCIVPMIALGRPMMTPKEALQFLWSILKKRPHLKFWEDED